MKIARLEIELALDTPESSDFAAWLNNSGHSARVGRSTGNYIGGRCTSSDEDANETMRALWDAFCAA